MEDAPFEELVFVDAVGFVPFGEVALGNEDTDFVGFGFAFGVGVVRVTGVVVASVDDAPEVPVTGGSEVPLSEVVVGTFPLWLEAPTTAALEPAPPLEEEDIEPDAPVSAFVEDEDDSLDWSRLPVPPEAWPSALALAAEEL